MSSIQNHTRTATFQSFDVDTTLHGSCRFCHHFFHGRRIRLHFSRYGNYQNSVICSECREENFALGGLRTRLSLMSQLTTPNPTRHPVNIFSAETGHPSERPHSSSLARIVSPANSTLDVHRSSDSNTSERRSDDMHSPLGSAPNMALESSHDPQVFATYAPIVNHDRRPFEGPVRSETDNATDPEIVTTNQPEPTKLERMLAKVRRSSRKLFLFTRLRPRKSGQDRNRTCHMSAIIGGPGADMPGQDEVVNSIGTAHSSSNSPPHHSVEQADEPKFCNECEVKYGRLRLKVTEARKAKDLDALAARVCPRECCVMARELEILEAELTANALETDMLAATNSRNVTRATGAWVNNETDYEQRNRSTLSFGAGSQQTTQVDHASY